MDVTSAQWNPSPGRGQPTTGGVGGPPAAAGPRPPLLGAHVARNRSDVFNAPVRSLMATFRLNKRKKKNAALHPPLLCYTIQFLSCQRYLY